ncbi:hypothetical protein KAU33_15460 [Candidatus Dependentiae bacterium]|nr:hypothetical protein [Candidatus Dependentiae bacterium]
MGNKKYYHLKHKITETELFQVLKEAGRRNWHFSITTDLDNMDFRDAEHDDIDLRDEYGDVLISNDLYKIVGFIVIECLRIENLEVFDGENTITFYEDVLHFNGSIDELKKILSKLSLNPEYWIEGVINP